MRASEGARGEEREGGDTANSVEVERWREDEREGEAGRERRGERQRERERGTEREIQTYTPPNPEQKQD